VPRPDWSRPLPRPLIIPDVLTLETLADVRALVEKHLPAEYRSKFTWRQLAGLLKRAAEGQQDVAEVSTALRIVLQLEGVKCREWLAFRPSSVSSRYRSSPARLWSYYWPCCGRAGDGRSVAFHRHGWPKGADALLPCANHNGRHSSMSMSQTSPAGEGRLIYLRARSPSDCRQYRQAAWVLEATSVLQDGCHKRSPLRPG